MKSLSPALQAHLDDGTTTLAWCWKITRADGQSFGFTDHDCPLAFGGTDYEPESGLSASEIGIVMGTFAAATFAVRLAIPFVVHRIKPWSMLTGALLVAGLSFAGLSFAQHCDLSFRDN